MYNRLNKTLVYLSGGMDRVIDWKKDAVQWRDELKSFLRSMNIGILDPCDKATLIAIEDENVRKKKKLLKEEGKYNELRDIMKPICAIDLRMVDIAHFVILYIDTGIHMTGSYHEATTAINQKKPVLIMCKQGKQNVPDWLYGVVPHEMMFSTWQELRDYLIHRFLDMKYIFNGTTT
jgi:nucleoside 2-deoxyribosyltransferase